MKSILIIFSIFLLLKQVVGCGWPHPDAKPNLNPIKPAALNLIGSSTNGKLYSVGTDNPNMKVLHLWGTPYEMGFAQGTLLKKEAATFLNEVWSYLEDQVIEAINGSMSKYHFQEWFLRDVANLGVEGACDLEILATSKFSGKYFLDEIKGLSDACGIDYKKIQRIHMLGELTKGTCSMFGAWGSAVPSGDGILQLRALDWNMDGPFHNYPQITVYHPATNLTDANGLKAKAFVNVGWTGWVGSITGMSEAKLAISEIGVVDPDDSWGKESRFGNPFTYILRDILQFDYTLDDAINRLSNARRTCNLLMGVGDGKEERGFRGIQYSASVANFYDDQNMRPDLPWHPKIKDVVYYSLGWLCHGYSQVLSDQLQKYYGKITPEITIQNILPTLQSGSTHIALYDLTKDKMYVSVARPDSQTGPDDAYDRPFLIFDTATLFAEKPPQ